MPLARVIALAAALVVFAAPGAGASPAGAPPVLAYSSAQSIPPSGRLPQGGDPVVTLNAAIGEREGAWLVVTGAQNVSAKIDGGTLGKLKADLSFAHYISFADRAVPDALLPWNGSSRPVEKPNQPLYLQVSVPADAQAGVYKATVTVSTDGRATDVPVTIRVFDVSLPPPAAMQGNLLTAFHVVPESYVNKVDELFHLDSNPARSAANVKLFAFLAAYRISPAGWGFGEPRTRYGYARSTKWWLDSAQNMIGQSPSSFATLRIPISNQRASISNRIAGISPFDLYPWCNYLQSVRGFWADHGWLDGHLAYLYALDEPGLEGMRIVAQQSATSHRCWPGSKTLVTGNPDPENRFLWDGKGGDDVDIWAVLSRRYYGQFFHPLDKLQAITEARQAGAMVWSSTYTGIAGTPGYSADEPLSDPRMFLLWNALEGIKGTLYAQGMTSYRKGNPFESVAGGGESVLLYPGADEPVPSARLEQIRDGIEDWDLFDLVRRKKGANAVRAILGNAGLFSTTPEDVELACTMGCKLSGSTKFAWPQWSHDAATAAKIEAAHLQALKLASG